jgi:hypothetical protein
MNLTAAGIAVLVLAVAWTMHAFKVGRKTVPWLLMLGSFGLVAGVAYRLLSRFAEMVVGTTGSVTRLLAGASVPLVAIVIIGTILVIKMNPKGPGPNRATPYLAFVFPFMVGALGGAVAARMGTVPDEVYAAVRSFLAAM